MSIEISEKNLAVSGEPVPDPQIEIAAERMALGIFENATAYLRGERESLRTVVLETTNPIHARAAAVFGSLLGHTEFGNDPRRLLEVDRDEYTDIEHDKHYQVVKFSEVVAQAGTRAVKAVTTLSTSADDIAAHVRVMYSSYEETTN